MNFGNLHSLAAQVIPQQQLRLRRFLGVETNDLGYQEPTYRRAVTIEGDLQPMTARDVAKLALDFREQHATLYTSASLRLAGPGTPPDKIEYGGKEYEIIGVEPWAAQDGWASYILVVV